MKRNATAALLVTIILGIGLLVWNDPMVQRVVGPRATPRPTAPATARPTIKAGDADAAAADAFMRGMCDRDEKRMRAVAGPPFSEWSDEHWATAVGAITPCTSVRLVASLVTQRGPEFLFVMDMPDSESEWFAVGVVGQRVVSVK